MTYKLIYLAKRNPRVTPEEFPEVWRSHSRLASTLGVDFSGHFRRVRQCIKIYDADVPPEYANDHDGSALLTMKSWDDLVAARSHAKALTTMRDDEPRVFADYAANFTMAARETHGLDRREGTAGLLCFAMRRPTVAPEDFALAWQELADKLTALDLMKDACGFALNTVIESPGPAYDFAGISEIWFDEADQARAAAWDDALRGTMRDLTATVADPAATVFLLTRLNFEKRPAS